MKRGCCFIWRREEHAQIRVHMAWMGYPLVGDSLYGNGKAGENVCGAYSLQCRFFSAIYREKDPAELP